MLLSIFAFVLALKGREYEGFLACGAIEGFMEIIVVGSAFLQ